MIPPCIVARLAETAAERNAIYRLRYAVYVDEMRKPYTASGQAGGMLTDPLDDSAVLIALTNAAGETVGTVRCNRAADLVACEPLATRLKLRGFNRTLLPHATICSRLIIARAYRKRGTLQPLVQAVYWWGLQHDILVNLIHTAVPLIPLFEHLGFRPYADRFMDEAAGAEQQPLYLLLREADHLSQVGSPFGDLLTRFTGAPTAGVHAEADASVSRDRGSHVDDPSPPLLPS